MKLKKIKNNIDNKYERKIHITREFNIYFSSKPNDLLIKQYTPFNIFKDILCYYFCFKINWILQMKEIL